MKKFDRLKKFEYHYRNAIDTIEMYRSRNDGMSILVEWMLTTSINPYSFLTDEWAGYINHAEGFASLLNFMSHALYDDGEITFIKVDGQPKIVFYSEHEDNFNDLVLSHMERILVNNRKEEIDVEILDCKPDEFGYICDEFNINRLKECFSMDAGHLGLDYAIKHYREYECFDESWIDTCNDEIEKWKGFYNKVRE